MIKKIQILGSALLILFVIGCSSNTSSEDGSNPKQPVSNINKTRALDFSWDATYATTNSLDGFKDVIALADGTYIAVDYNSLSLVDTNGTLLWDNTFATYGVALAFDKAQDGGYIIAGYGQNTFNSQDKDFKLTKTDSLGNPTWVKFFYSGSTNDSNEYAYSVKQCSDGGYIMAGDVYHYSFPYNKNMFVVKTDANGNKLWATEVGGAEDDNVKKVIEIGGAYYAAGTTTKSGDKDFLLAKINADGTIAWQQSYGKYTEYFADMQPTSDGGIILMGSSYDGTNNYVYLVKVAGNGSVVWESLFDSTALVVMSLVQTNDEGYLITGYGYNSFSLIKTDSDGKKIMEKNYDDGLLQTERMYSIKKTNDGAFILAGMAEDPGLKARLTKIAINDTISPAVNIKDVYFHVDTTLKLMVEGKATDDYSLDKVVIELYESPLNTNPTLVQVVDANGKYIWNYDFNVDTTVCGYTVAAYALDSAGNASAKVWKGPVYCDNEKPVVEITNMYFKKILYSKYSYAVHAEGTDSDNTEVKEVVLKLYEVLNSTIRPVFLKEAVATDLGHNQWEYDFPIRINPDACGYLVKAQAIDIFDNVSVIDEYLMGDCKLLLKR